MNQSVNDQNVKILKDDYDYQLNPKRVNSQERADLIIEQWVEYFVYDDKCDYRDWSKNKEEGFGILQEYWVASFYRNKFLVGEWNISWERDRCINPIL